MRVLLIFVCLLQLTACTGFWAACEGSYNQQAIELRRLGNAVQSELWRGAAPDSDLLELACARDPALCAPFKDNRVLVSTDDNYVALLLCDRARTRALVEDVSCTPETDRLAWEDKRAPCAFTIDISAHCAK